MPVTLSTFRPLSLLAATPATSNSTSGGGIGFLVISVLAIGAFILLIRRSNTRRQGYAQQVMAAAEIGSEVMTNSGLFGTVVGGDDEQVLLEIAPGVQVRFARAAIARVLAAEDPLDDAMGSHDGPDGPDSPHGGTGEGTEGGTGDGTDGRTGDDPPAGPDGRDSPGDTPA